MICVELLDTTLGSIGLGVLVLRVTAQVVVVALFTASGVLVKTVSHFTGAHYLLVFPVAVLAAGLHVLV